MRTVDISTEILIMCSRDKVAAYASEPLNATEWYVNIKSVEYLPAAQAGEGHRPLKLGTRLAFKAEFLGKQLAYVYEIVEFVPGEKLVMRTADGPFPMETTYLWESIDGNTTRMKLRNRGTPSGFSKLLAPFMKFAMKKANRKDLERLKQILESRQTSR
jgi:hypothetical protein